MQKTVNFLWNKGLILTYDEHFQLAISFAEGEGVVVIVEMKASDEANPHASVMVNELCMHFSSPPAAGENLDASKVLRKAIFQGGESLLLYQSAQFTGTVCVKRWEPGSLVSGSCDLVFSHPLVDRTGVGEVHIQTDF